MVISDPLSSQLVTSQLTLVAAAPKPRAQPYFQASDIPPLPCSLAHHLTSVTLPPQDLKQQLSGCQEAVSLLQQQHNQWEEEGEALRQRLQMLTGERDTLAGQTVDLQGEVDSLSK